MPKQISRKMQHEGADLFDKAHALVDSGNPREGFLTIKKALEAGDKNAYLSLGYFLDHGIGVRKSHKKALDLYKKAYLVKGSERYAAYNIALSYRDLFNNPKRAAFWLKRALDAGDADAGVQLAKLYIEAGRYRQKAIELLSSVLSSDDGTIYDDTREEAERLLEHIVSPRER